MIGVGFAVAKGLGLAGQFASGILSAQARRAEFDEGIRRLSLKRDQTLGLANARAAASGLLPGAGTSTDAYLARLTGEFDTELGAMRKARSAIASSDLLGNLAGLLGGGADIAGGLGKLNNWSF